MWPMDLGPVYRLGRVVMTAQARAILTDQDLAGALLRHVRRVWGETDDVNRPGSGCARLEGCRLLSSCRANNGTRFWIISEPDKSCTRILLPEEYPPPANSLPI